MDMNTKRMWNATMVTYITTFLNEMKKIMKVTLSAHMRISPIYSSRWCY